jgi:aromatic ring-cleaving dioxygenase
MPEAFADPAGIESYHAHIYYDPATRPLAERLRQAIGDGFTVELGRWHDVPWARIPRRCIRWHFPSPSSHASCRG